MSQAGGELIGMGSFGCVFNPSLRCPGEKESKENVVSKVFFSKNGKKELNNEYTQNLLIKNIKGYKQWAEVWYKKCKPSDYKKIYLEEPEIEDCLEENNIEPEDFNKIRMMLQGEYGGITFTEYMDKKFKKSILNSEDKFVKEFLQVMKDIKNLFIGLSSMYKHRVGHNDIKSDNIVIDKNGSRFIDFGFTCKYTDKTFYKKRGVLEFITDRIYPPYPYEFIYLYTTADVLKDNDRVDLNNGVNRSLHDRYIAIHDNILGRKSKSYISNLVNYFIKEGSKIRGSVREKEIISLLDTYSLGMVMLSCLCKIAKKHGKIKNIKKFIRSKKIKSFIDLFKHMTEPDSFNRINPKDAYDKYLELEKLYLTKKINDKKRTKRKN